LVLLSGIAAFGAVGALARYWLGRYVAEKTGAHFPWGTFLINVSGAFLLGLLNGLPAGHPLSGAWKTALGGGFCGAFTTFSTWSVETVRLAEKGRRQMAWANLVLSVVAGLLAAGAGLALGERL